jgi:hypothetical protein
MCAAIVSVTRTKQVQICTFLVTQQRIATCLRCRYIVNNDDDDDDDNNNNNNNNVPTYKQL